MSNETTPDVTSKPMPDRSNIPAIQQMLLHALQFRREHPEFFVSVETMEHDDADKLLPVVQHGI